MIEMSIDRVVVLFIVYSKYLFPNPTREYVYKTEMKVRERRERGE
jgi:hypothetical protein